MLQALHFLNSKNIMDRLKNPNARPAKMIAQKLADKEIVTETYLWLLARHPSEAEMKVSLNYLQKHAKRHAEAVQDLFWALLNSRDFKLLH
jgi:hypothetical protein